MSAKNPAPRVLAFCLPQFYRIPENDAWWGEGFTEWTNLRQAQALLEGHDPPMVPDEATGYYDLSDPGVLRRQAERARAHGIHGFVFYHYWFGGRKRLEKPLETLLSDQDLDLPFCLAWANEPWSRNWNGSQNELFVDQDYGGEEAWTAHFEYVAPFLADRRALRLDGFPLLLINRSGHIPCLGPMMACWRKFAAERGMGELRILAVLNFHQDGYRVEGERQCFRARRLKTSVNSWRPSLAGWTTVSPICSSTPGTSGAKAARLNRMRCMATHA